MKRTTLLILAVLSALAAATQVAAGSGPSAHKSTVTEVGSRAGNPAPACPGSGCRVVTRTSGYNRTVGKILNPDTATATGRIVAFTLRIAHPTRSQRAYFSRNFGPGAQVQISILRAVTHRPSLTFRAVHVSEVFHIEPYMGKTAQFALDRSLPIKKGDIVAVTVPTWAPILATNRSSSTSWRASRNAGQCGTTPNPKNDPNISDRNFADLQRATQHDSRGSDKRYRCVYGTAQLAYSATEVTTP